MLNGSFRSVNLRSAGMDKMETLSSPGAIVWRDLGVWYEATSDFET